MTKDRAFTLCPDGFVVRFPNNLGLSIRWSPFHYCHAREGNPVTRGVALNKATASESAEVALLLNDGVEREIIGEPVAYVRPKHLARMMELVGSYQVDKELEAVADLIPQLEAIR